MFERFTDRARGAVVLAEEEARMLNHNWVGTEHLLLDAVVAEFGRPAGDPPYGCEFELRDPDGNRLRIRKSAS